MPFQTGIYSIIHEASNADFVNYSYYQVYFGVDSTITLNGQIVNLAATMTIDIPVKSISPTPNVYLLGDKKDVTTGSLTLNNYL